MPGTSGGPLFTILYAALIALDHQALSDAQRLFYNGRYDAAAAVTLQLRAQEPADLAAFEIRTSTLLFQLKAELGDRRDRDAAF